jgi:hypothetical protein
VGVAVYEEHGHTLPPVTISTLESLKDAEHKICGGENVERDNGEAFKKKRNCERYR